MANKDQAKKAAAKAKKMCIRDSITGTRKRPCFDVQADCWQVSSQAFLRERAEGEARAEGLCGGSQN